MKTNVIPDRVSIDVDVRTLPGETSADVDAHLKTALGDLYGRVQTEILQDEPATASPTDNIMWSALERAMARPYSELKLVPSLVTGGTDSRYFRQKGAIAFGAGLLSPQVSAEDFLMRFHGHNERIDVESLRLTTQLWLDVVDLLWDQ